MATVRVFEVMSDKFNLRTNLYWSKKLFPKIIIVIITSIHENSIDKTSDSIRIRSYGSMLTIPKL
jgi:hypothetical protein